jgi:hypothetical protein
VCTRDRWTNSFTFAVPPLGGVAATLGDKCSTQDGLERGRCVPTVVDMSHSAPHIRPYRAATARLAAAFAIALAFTTAPVTAAEAAPATHGVQLTPAAPTAWRCC